MGKVIHVNGQMASSMLTSLELFPVTEQMLPPGREWAVPWQTQLNRYNKPHCKYNVDQKGRHIARSPMTYFASDAFSQL